MGGRFTSVVVVVMTALLVTGMIAPAAATAGVGETQPAPAADPAVGLDDDRPALDHRLEAYRILDEAGEQRHLDALNATFERVIDANRVNASLVFQEDKRIVAQTQAKLPEAAKQLAASDRVLAETAVADAERVRQEMARRNLSYDEAAVEAELANASEALQEGHDHEAGNASPVAAVAAYHRAWRHAQRALDQMQAAVEPQVEITRRADPRHNGSIEYTIEGVVWDVRSHRMDGTVTVNVEDHDLTLETATVPGENVSFATTVTVDDPVTEINVSVANPLEYVDYSRGPAESGGPPDGQQGPPAENDSGLPDDNGQGPPDDNGQGPPDDNGQGQSDDNGGGPPGDDEDETGPPGNGNGPPDDGGDEADEASGGPPGDEERAGQQVGVDVLKLDGDGLPDRYEATVVGTEPLDPDSDSRFTDRDEADLGLVDGAKDFSGDGLSASQEYQLGTNPLRRDTSGDGLEDGFQVLRAGTDPLVNDTDGDGLSDYEEAFEYDTDPLNSDGDDDGLADGAEIRVGSDPSVADTDGDGVADGNETHTTTAVNESSGVEVAATGEGAVAQDIHVQHQPSSGAENFTVGPTVRITNSTAVEQATVTIPIDADVDLASTNVTVYKWDPADDEGWVPLETEIDLQNRTASATVSSFSYFATFEAETWATGTGGSSGTGGHTQPGWPALETFGDLDGWQTAGDGDVSLAGQVATVESDGAGESSDDGDDGSSGGGGEDEFEQQSEENWDVPGGGGDGGGGDGGDDGGGGSDDGSGGDDGSSGDDGSGGSDGTTSEPTSAALSRSVSVPDGAASIEIQVRVRATTGPNGTAAIVLEGAQSEVQVLDLGDGATTAATDWVTLNRTVPTATFAGTEPTLAVHTEGNATVQVDYAAVLVDSTGSGLPDAVERLDLGMPTGPPDVRGTPLALDPATNDTDGDGLDDGEEVTVDWRIEEVDGTWQLQGEVTNATAHPAMVDTDGDSLEDGTEVFGWNVTVVNKTAGEHAEENPYRWHSGQVLGPDEATGTVRFDADPLQVDTDGDRLTDVEEHDLRTDPYQERTYEVTATREAMLRDLYEAWTGSSERSTDIAQSVGAMDLSALPVELQQYEDNFVAPPTTMEQFRDVELTDATDDFDVVVGEDATGPLEQFVYRTPDDQRRTDVWLSNQEEVRHDAALDPWAADSDSDGLTDGQEIHGVTIVPRVAESVRVEVEEVYITQPDDPDSDEDDALDGGGPFVVNDHRLGRQITDDDPYIDHGELWELPTDPAYADVTEVFVVTDEEFRDQHANHREDITDMIQVANRSLGEEFEADERTTVLVVTRWGQWESPDAISGTSPRDHRREMADNIGWPDNDRGTDLVIGFSGQEMGRDPGGSTATKYSDGVAEPGTNSIMIGTNDLTVTNSLLDSYDLEFHLVLHEIGHLYGAKHPGDSDIPDGTEGVMCKNTCVPDWTETLKILATSPPGLRIIRLTDYHLSEKKWMYTTYDFSTENHERIRSNIANLALADYHRENKRSDN